MKARSQTHYVLTWNSHLKDLVFLMDEKNIDEVRTILDRLKELVLEASIRLDLPLSDHDTMGEIERGWYHRDFLAEAEKLEKYHVNGTPLTSGERLARWALNE